MDVSRPPRLSRPPNDIDVLKRPHFLFQIQTDKEKLLYELDNLQRELEKAQVNTTRFQHEKEDFEVDAGRQREKNEKLQVIWSNKMTW